MRKGSKHHHYAVTITYPDGEEFQRVYIDRKKAEAFAERQKKSPAVKGVQITELQREGQIDPTGRGTND